MKRTGIVLVMLVLMGLACNLTESSGEAAQTPGAPGPQEVGQLQMTPAQFADGWYRLPTDQPVTISWPEAPPGAVQVTFYLTPTGTGTADAQAAIGSDTNLGDGASLSWLVPSGGFGAHLHAVAYDGNGGRIIASHMSQVYAE